MLRSRGQDEAGRPGPSTCQVAARFLLYHNDAPWANMTIAQVRAHLRNALPQYLRGVWDRANLPTGTR
eukprot:11543827-Prorocentrum_lima.AAC.1